MVSVYIVVMMQFLRLPPTILGIPIVIVIVTNRIVFFN
jgi:hypothetical protein